MAKVAFDEDRCKGCALCVGACPKGIVSMRVGFLNGEGMVPAGVEEMGKCVGCCSCAVMCPDSAIEVYR